MNNTFNVPDTSGMAYSFTDDGFFEVFKYSFFANPKDPKCYRAQLIWQHGNFTMNDATGELNLTQYVPDGRMQLYSPCMDKKGNNVVSPYVQCVAADQIIRIHDWLRHYYQHTL